MSGRKERDSSASLDGLSEEQLDFVREQVFFALYSRAGSLQRLNEHPDPKGLVREVAALGRLAESLQDDSVRVPDRAAAEAVRGMAADVDEVHETEAVFEQYERALREREAMRALVDLFADPNSRGPSGRARKESKR